MAFIKRFLPLASNFLRLLEELKEMSDALDGNGRDGDDDLKLFRFNDQLSGLGDRS